MGAGMYKGIPKAQWAAHKASLAERNPMTPNAFVAELSPEIASLLVEEVKIEPPKVDVPRETSPVNSDSDGPVAPPRNLFSGQMKALDVYGINGSTIDPIPDYRLRWFNDIANRISMAISSGWGLVSKDEIALQDNLVPGNNDLGSYVRKVVNPNLVPPMYGYLMKKPRKLDDLHQAEAQRINDRMEQSLRAGSMGAGPADGRYVAGDIRGSVLPKIEIANKLYR